MSNPPPKIMQDSQPSRSPWKKILPVKRKGIVSILSVLGAFAVVVVFIVLVSHDFIWERVTLASVFFLFASSSLAERSLEAGLKEQPWKDLAARTGLEYQTGNLLLGRPTRVTGTYRDRHVSLYSYKMGRGNLCTRIEFSLNQPTSHFFRIRGPYERGEIVSEEAFRSVFGGGSLYSIGYERFFIRSYPRKLAADLFGTDGRQHGPLRYRLLKIKQTANIELDSHRLHFEQFGVVVDMEYLEMLLELLHDITVTVEDVSPNY